MNRRKIAIQVIIAEVARTGVAGRCALRAYVENRVSRQTFDEACRIGLMIWERGQKKAAEAAA